MPVKSRGSEAVVETKRTPRKLKAVTSPVPHPDTQYNPGVREMLEQIRVRGDQLSAEIKQLLVRLG